MQSDTPAIAITGTGCCCAAGFGSDIAWDAVCRGIAPCRPAPPWLFETSLSFPVFAVDEPQPGRRGTSFSIADWLATPWNEANRTLQLTVAALAEALDNSALSLEELRRKRVGIALGTTVGCTFNHEAYYIDWKTGRNPDRGPVFNYLSSNLALGLQSLLKIRGPIAVVTNACASGTDALGVAMRWLKNDLCDLVISGGADELSRIAYYGFASLMLTANAPCQPFDQKRNGLNLGEGAGILVLEKSGHTGSRKPLGWLLGYGCANDAHHPTAPHPQGRGLQQALRDAIADAGVVLADINLINAHGTGTRANDQAEAAALAAIGFQEISCPVVSTKGNTGHTLGAAGALEAILTLKALREGYTPGTTGCLIPDQTLSFSVLPVNKQRKLNGPIGISQSLAFGGGNAALVLEANVE